MPLSFPVSAQSIMEELVVKGRAAIEGSVGSSLSIQRESESVLEVVGSEEFSRLGDSTAADTLQRITGLNVEEGKFVVIRGQPLRYTSTLFNGSQMPSLDPIQSVTPLDLFPSGVLSNITIQKTYSADRPGSFGSGQVQLSTTGLSAEDFIELKVSSGVNFRTVSDDPLEFATGDDIIGNLNDALKLPEGVRAAQDAGTPIATLPQGERLEVIRSFSNELAPNFAGKGPDVGMSLTGAKRLDTAFGTFGASLAFGYDQDIRTEDEQRRVLQLSGGGQVAIRDNSMIDRTELNTSLGGLFAVTWEWDRHQLKSNTFWVRDVVEKTEINKGVFEPSNLQFEQKFTLEFERRELLIQQISGSHDFDVVKLDWRGLYSEANRDLPDRREFSLENTALDGSGLFFLSNQAPNLLRRWNAVDEETLSGGLDVTIPVPEHLLGDLGITLGIKGGVDKETRDRVSETREFGFNFDGINRFRPVEQIFADENIGVDVSFTEFAGVGNDYTADVEIEGSYVQLDAELPDLLRLVFGVRFEQAEFDVETFESGAAGTTVETSGFFRRDELPSFLASWQLSENMQLRGGIARSLAYPTPVEISNTTFIDPDSKERFQGNPDLEPVVIDSYDLRWEWYPTRAEALTLGIFYKYLDDPIERSFTAVAGGGQGEAVVTFVNGIEGEVYGVEFNGRVGLDRLRELFGGPDWLDDIHFGANFTGQKSDVLLAPGTAATSLKRRMTGQPEILANAEFGYTGPEHIVRVALGFTSDHIVNAGIQGLPDEFIESRWSLGGKWSYTPSFLEAATLSLELDNLLNDEFQRSQGPFLTRNYKTGISASLGFQWRFGY